MRPTDLGSIFGQDHLLPLLADWCDQPALRIPKSLLITGPYGCGKTTIARILAAKLTTVPSDVLEINAASARGVDDARGWAEAARIRPFGGARVFVIDELHQMTKDAQSSLLKTLEEPPPATHFFLCTTEPTKLLAPLRSRCTQLEVRLFDEASTISLLRYLFRGVITDDTASRIHLRTGGHARDSVKVAEVVRDSGEFNEATLDQTFGLSFPAATNLLFKYVGSPTKESRAHLFNTLVGLEKGAGELVDSWVDALAQQEHPAVVARITDLMTVRSLRRKYELTVRDQVIHLLSILGTSP